MGKHMKFASSYDIHGLINYYNFTTVHQSNELHCMVELPDEYALVIPKYLFHKQFKNNLPFPDLSKTVLF